MLCYFLSHIYCQNGLDIFVYEFSYACYIYILCFYEGKNEILLKSNIIINYWTDFEHTRLEMETVKTCSTLFCLRLGLLELWSGYFDFSGEIP